MTLARRMTLALGLLACAVLAAEAVLEVRREQTLALEDMAHDHRLLARTLGAALAREWRQEGRAEALALLERASSGQSELQLRWVWLDGGARPGGEEAPLLPLEALGAVREGRELTREAPPPPGFPPGSPHWLVSYAPLAVDGRPAALEVSEPLTAVQGQVRRSILALALSTAAIALLFFAAAFALGRRLVGRPVQALQDMARRVGAGDFSARVSPPAHDELGELGAAMNRMAEQLGRAQGELREATERRLAALEQLRHADRLTTVGKLAAGLAHELGTPLNVVQGEASMVAAGEVAGEEARRSARVVVEQARGMTRIIRQLLDFARRRAPSRAPEPVDALLGQAVALLRSLALKRGVQLEAGPPCGLEAEVDAGQLQQVLTNLVVNALHATPLGGTVRLSARAVEAPLPAALREEEAGAPGGGGPGAGAARAWVRVDVEDSGAGIPPDVLPRLFEPFFTTKDVGEGTGLGLSVAWGLVRDHGGWIAVQSTPGRGSCFSVFLPHRSPVAP